jgi:hypothetical protein
MVLSVNINLHLQKLPPGQNYIEVIMSKWHLISCGMFVLCFIYYIGLFWRSTRNFFTIGISSWIYNYLCKHCLSPLKLEPEPQLLDTTLCDKDCQWLATGLWFSPGTPVSSTNKTDHHDLTEILLKVALNTINQQNQPTITYLYHFRNIIVNACGIDVYHSCYILTVCTSNNLHCISEA